MVSEAVSTTGQASATSGHIESMAQTMSSDLEQAGVDQMALLMVESYVNILDGAACGFMSSFRRMAPMSAIRHVAVMIFRAMRDAYLFRRR